MEAESDAYIRQLSRSFMHLREAGKLCDTVLVTADRRLLAHSVVLAAASPVFRAAFQSCSADGCMNYQLQLDGLDGQLMETILNCIYSGSVTELKSLSSAVDMHSVVEICAQLALNWIITDIKDANSLVDQAVQVNNTEISNPVTGCYHQDRTEKCLSVQYSENSIEFNDPLYEICTASMPAVYDSPIAGSTDRLRTSSLSSSLLYSAVEAMDSSVLEELCLYVCDICNLRFSTGVTLRRHRRHHKDAATCIDCGHSFYSATILRHHSLMQCPRKTVMCNICWTSFVGWPILSRHTVTTHPTAHVCAVCGQAFLNVDQLFSHRTIHATYVYQCRTCARSFGSRSRVKRHVTMHTTDCDAGCISEGCLKKLSGGGLIPENQLKQVNADAYGNWFKRLKGDASLPGFSLNGVIEDASDALRKCLKQATAAAGYVSDSSHAYSAAHRLLPLPSSGCSLPAAVPNSNGHVGERHIVLRFDQQAYPDGDAAGKAVSSDRVACAECSRTFKRLSDLHVHMQCHTGEMRYKCDECGRPFRKSGTLARHMRIHTGERPYICETCGKSYKLLFHLRLHMTVHSSDRPFTCDICAKSFQSATSLKKHRFVHTGVKPFSCPICMRLFNRCSNMRAHMRVHDGTRQHEVFSQEHACILCQKKFGNAASFQAHLQIHAREIGLHVGETITAVDSADNFGTEMTYGGANKQHAEDVYVALPLVHLDDFDIS